MILYNIVYVSTYLLNKNPANVKKSACIHPRSQVLSYP